MELKLLFPILKQNKSKLSAEFLRTVLRCSAFYHNKSWEFESDDEGSRPSYRSRNSSNFNKNDWDRPSYNRQNNDWDRPRNNYQDRDYDRPSYQRGNRSFDSAGGNLSKPNWKATELQPFDKNFFKPSESLLNRSREDVEEFRKKHNLSLLGKDIPNPIMEFTDHEFPNEVTNTFAKKNFETPTPIQAQGWPIALSGRDFIGIGQTGSGKTLGYTVPGLIHITNQQQLEAKDGPIGLVLAPTRELVQQIHEVSFSMFSSARMKTSCLFGGASKHVQANSLFKKPSFCIATPGRLLDFLEMGVTNLKRCTYLVLDEADRMLDMGFEPQIRKIVDQIRPDRQTLMWSATWPKEVEELACDFLNDFVRLNVGSLDLTANPDIEQLVEVCDRYDKQQRFLGKLQEEVKDDHGKVLVFAQTKSQVDILERILYREGIKARGIHGDHSQARRDQTLQGFRGGRFKVLVATDVASRGLDVDDISLVVNYDFPQCIEDYIHRIGRTARAGKAGRAYSILTEHDWNMANELIRVLKHANQEVPPELHNLKDQGMSSKRSKKSFGGNRYNKGRENYFR